MRAAALALVLAACAPADPPDPSPRVVSPSTIEGCAVRGPQQLAPADANPISGGFNLAWQCVSACGTLPPPALTRATRLDLQADGRLAWSRAGVAVATHAAVVTGRCRRVAADDTDGCRAWYELCPTVEGRAAIYFLHWYDIPTQRWQTWSAVSF